MIERRIIASKDAAAQKGTVLLLALIVMSSVVLSSMGLGSLIVSSLQQSRIIDAASVAYYAAESGAEDALYAARRRNQIPASTVTPTLLGNGASWIRTVTTDEEVVYVGTIPEDSLVEIALYDPDTQIPAAAASVEITWTGTATLTTSLVGWQPGTAWDPDSASSVDFAAARHSGNIATLSVPSPTKLYRLRLRATNGAMDDVRIRAYDSIGVTVVPLPGRISIDSRGTYSGTEQKLLVSLPRKTPLSGIYDFIVFSECSIVKGGAVSCP